MSYFKSIFILLIIGLFSCSSELLNENAQLPVQQNLNQDSVKIQYDSTNFDRTEITAEIQRKIQNKEPLVVHCFVPLCDNINQGIVPTSASLGDGMSTRTNLYWATSNGMKKYFVKNEHWKTFSIQDSIDENVLQRAIFKRTFPNGAEVILINDAYRGDRMKECLENYFQELAVNSTKTIALENDTLDLNNVDLVAFNGHNGLMDVEVDPEITLSKRKKDAAVIGCISRDYFIDHIHKANAYPLVTTTGLMYPGAFVLDGVIEKWAVLENEVTIKNGAGDAYHRVKKCGQRAGRNLFYTGWLD